MISFCPICSSRSEALEEGDVALVLHVRHLEGDGRSRSLVDGFEDRRHAAPREELGELVLVEPVARDDFAHVLGP